MMRQLLTTIPGILLLATAGCSDGTVTGAGDGDATTEVRIHGDAPNSTNESRAESTSEGSADVEGSMEVSARVYVQSEAGQWVEVTRGTAEQTVEASGDDGFKVLARSEVEAQSYHRVRIEFEEVQGDLSGSVLLGLGGGSSLVSLDVGGDGRVTVEREVDFVAQAGTTTHLDIDLNTAAWAGESSDAGVVAEGAFTNAVSIAAS